MMIRESIFLDIHRLPMARERIGFWIQLGWKESLGGAAARSLQGSDTPPLRKP